MTELRRMRGPLVRWYDAHARDLPWRRTRDPYAVWVSEIMLQQTRVATVLPYYDRFLRRFPDLATLAAAGEEQVLACWSGLGYYRRARALHAGARAVLECHDGRLPDDPEALRSLPGVGRYTAGAIASIAFERDEPILDGNVRRVLSRLLALDASRMKRVDEERTLWAAARELVRGRRPGRLNQALMELGALVCTPSAPDCSHCPTRRGCAAFAAGRTEAFPTPRPKPPTRSVAVAVAWIPRAGHVLLQRPPSAGPLRGSWDLPAVELERDGDATGLLRERLGADGLEVSVRSPLLRLRHGIMNRVLTLEVFDCRLRRGRVAGTERMRWVRPAELDGTAHSGATRKIVHALTRYPAS